MNPERLPIDPALPAILSYVRSERAVVITAAPGAGKTTRVPVALATDGPVIVLQPRRVAARSLARRVAMEQGWTIGREVGWHVRFERQFGPTTQVLFATEGILTARLQQDPLLTDFRTIVLDEFHERTIHADLGIALAKQAWQARSDLRIAIMSATIDAASVASFLDDCPVVDVPGALHPLEIRYASDLPLADAVGTCLRETSGQVLCFLAGAGEINRAAGDVGTFLRRHALDEVEVVQLHGSLGAAAQDEAIAASKNRRVILATNIAETSLTVPGVRAVVDAGDHKVARYDPDRAIDSLELERISADAATQRAGRAGRLGPGLAIRLWSESHRLRAHREPEIQRIDLSGVLLDILAWGGNPRSFEWFDRPASDRIDSAFRLLDRLGATTDERLTDRGRRMQRMPLSPRLSAILLAANGSREAALACAMLSERHTRLTPDGRAQATTTSDLLSAIERPQTLPAHVARTADALHAMCHDKTSGRTGDRMDEAAFRRALLAGYPDRVAQRREPGSSRVLLASGHGAAIGLDSGVRDGDYVIALDVTAGRRGAVSEATIRLASIVDREWLEPTHTSIDHVMDRATGTVRAIEREYYDAIVLSERPARADPLETVRLLVDAFLDAPLDRDDEQVVRRMRFAELSFELRVLAERAAAGARAVRDVKLARGLTADERQRLDRLAPVDLLVPSGRRTTLVYQDDGSVTAEVKLQELFGLADTPRIGGRHEPVLFALLAPNGRPVQMTRDLRSFWTRTYPEVRKELRGRYPKHSWPEDPWSAPPTARTTRRGVK